MITYNEVKSKFDSFGGIKCISIIESKDIFNVFFQFDTLFIIRDTNFYLDNNIKVSIPKDYPTSLPRTSEYLEKQINNYHHLFANEENIFCLGTEIDIRRKLYPDYDLTKYILLIAEFIGTYEYFKTYNCFPNGERSHNVEGVMETYKDLFNLSKDEQVFNLLEIGKINNKLRNKRCPCGSEVKMKKCHWNILLRYQSNPLMYSQMKIDLNYLLNYLKGDM